MRNLDMFPYIDKYGLITTSEHDGGDSSHKTAHYAIATEVLPTLLPSPYIREMRWYFLEKGLVRHPDPEKWYSEPQRYSRDQFAPQVIYSAFKRDPWLKKFFRKHKENFLLYTWNTRHNWVYPESDSRYNPHESLKYDPPKMPDITSPFEFWGFYIRGFRCWLLYPWLILSDIETLISAVIKRFDKDCDVNNCLAACLLAMRVMPTGIGHLAYLILKPVLKRKLREYWAENKYEPPIGEFYIKALDLE